jgi:hypothetical protein
VVVALVMQECELLQVVDAAQALSLDQVREADDDKIIVDEPLAH